jgi:hypothetical protein
MTASEPNRFFAGSSKAMNRETRRRNSMLAQLKIHSDEINSIMELIDKKDPGEEVTYSGK